MYANEQVQGIFLEIYFFVAHKIIVIHEAQIIDARKM